MGVDVLKAKDVLVSMGQNSTIKNKNEIHLNVLTKS
jgi:hypothetical protein